jgi:hypothetical protein
MWKIVVHQQIDILIAEFWRFTRWGQVGTLLTNFVDDGELDIKLGIWQGCVGKLVRVEDSPG